MNEIFRQKYQKVDSPGADGNAFILPLKVPI
jgi:hypothetical protein